MLAQRLSAHPEHRDRRGVSLVVALVLLAMISLLALTVTSAHMATHRLLERRYDGRQAEYLARAGVELAVADLLTGRGPAFRETYSPMRGANVEVVVSAQPDKTEHVQIQSAAVYPATGRRRSARETRRIYRILRDEHGAPRECLFVSGPPLRQPQYVRADDPNKRAEEQRQRHADELAFWRNALRRGALGRSPARPSMGAPTKPQGWAGSQLGGPRIVPLLIELLEDEDSTVRAEAARALTQFGRAARPAVPALTKALNDEDPDVRRAAAELLEQLRALDAKPKDKR